MNYIKQILKKILRKIFNIKNNTLAIEKSKDIKENQNRENFLNSLQVKIQQSKRKNKIETQECVGDGLGIQTKISF